MNSTSYAFAQFLKMFGIHRKQARLNDSAQELQLLREGEHLLGKTLWQDCEDYEPTDTPYWHLRQLNNKVSELQQKITNLSDDLAEAQHQKQSSTQNTRARHSEKETERIQLIGKAEELTNEKQELAGQAKQLKDQYEGLKLKIKVLREENADTSVIEKQVARAEQLKSEFTALKQKNVTLVSQIKALDTDIDRLEGEARAERGEFNNQISSPSEDLNKANRDLSNLRSEIGLLQSQMNQHYSELGNILFSQFKHDRDCRTIAKSQKHFIAILAALRRSIEWNNDLAERH